MSIMRGLVTAMIGALVLGACATGREFGFDGHPVYRTSEVDVSPRLIGCNDYDPLSERERTYQRSLPVRVTFIVTVNGSVDPRSVAPSLGAPRVDPQMQEDALALARGCSYTPAELDDERVAVRLSRSFRVERR